MKKVCQTCGHDRFVTTGIEYHDWVVDGDGNFIDDLGCFDSALGVSELQCLKCESLYPNTQTLKEIE